MKKSENLIPVPGLDGDAGAKLSRQQRYKMRQYAKGLCTSCGSAQRAPTSRSLCPACLAIQRERMRTRSGSGRRNFKAASYAPATNPIPVEANPLPGASPTADATVRPPAPQKGRVGANATRAGSTSR